MTCRICGSSAVGSRFRLSIYNVVACSTCGVRFLDPQPSDEALAAIYTADYFFARDDEANRTRHAALKAASARRTIALAPPASSGGRLLDIGCGTGDFLLEARSLGYAVTGIEFSQSSCDTAVARLNGNVICGTLESANLAAESLDVVASTDVIEHVRDPIAFAREMRRVLAPGGVALVTTPSTDSWSGRLLGSRWMENKVEHLFYFDRQSLITALRSAGFVTITVRPNVKILSADYIAAHFEKFPEPFDGRILAATARLLPKSLRYRPFPIVASGITAVAR